MRDLIPRNDLKRLAMGAAVASLAGLMLGGAMRPNLDEHEATGPRILMGEHVERTLPAAYDRGVGAYQGELPEYVVGTDWTRPRAVPVMQADPLPEEAGETVVYEAAPVLRVASPTYREPAPEPLYPSLRGNTPYESDLPPPPAAPRPDVDGAPIVVVG